VIAIVDYGAGNLRSVQKAFDHLGVSSQVVRSRAELGSAERLVLPGVGAFGTAMEKLKTSGLLEGVEEWLGSGAPFLGICLGMQMLLEDSAESEGVAGLGFLKGSCLPFREGKVPQIGWNQLTVQKGSRLLQGIDDGSFFYFLHGYYVDPQETEVVTATTEYGVRYPSVIERDNVAAVQFHPEKSGELGLRLLENWVRSC
jgi:glutamine amidotransferase